MFESPGSDANHTLPINVQTPDEPRELSRGSDVPRHTRKRPSVDPTLHEFQMCPIEEAEHLPPFEASEGQRTPGHAFQVLLPTASRVSSWSPVELSSPTWDLIDTASVTRSSVSTNLDLASKRSYSDISPAEAGHGHSDVRYDRFQTERGENMYLTDDPGKQRISIGIPAIGGKAPAFEVQRDGRSLLQRSPSKRLRIGSESLLAEPHLFPMSSAGKLKGMSSLPISIQGVSRSVSEIHNGNFPSARAFDVVRGPSTNADPLEGSSDLFSSTCGQPSCGGPTTSPRHEMAWTSNDGEHKGFSTYCAHQEFHRSLIRQKSDTPEPDTMVTATYSNICSYSPDGLFPSDHDYSDEMSAS